MSTPATTTEEPIPAQNAGPAETRKPVCTLWCKTAKSNVNVYGRSGKRYAFSRERQLNKVVRHYYSREEFEREEGDLRGLRQNQLHEVVVLLGESDPVRNAVEGVKALAAAVRRVPVNVREAVLQEVAGLCVQEIERIKKVRAKAQQQDSAAEREARQAAARKAEHPAAPAPPAPPKDKPFPDEWRDDDGAPVDPGSHCPAVTPVETTAIGPVLTAPPQAQVQAGNLTHADLMQMPFNDLKKLAASKGVTVKNLGKDKIADGYLEAQAAGFPNKGGGQ